MKIKFRIFLIVSVIIYLSLCPQETAHAATNLTVSPVIISDNLSETTPSEITPFGDRIVWKYKTINGVLYRRKYNYTKKEWIGDWIKV